MSTSKHINIVCLMMMIGAILLTILFMNGEVLGLIPLIDEDSPDVKKHFTQNDLDGGWDTDRATKVSLTGEIIGDGAYFLNGDLVISKSGYYVVDGELADGSIIIDVNKNAKVWIMLNGAHIYCSDDAALIVEQGEKVFLTLADGTENYIGSGGVYSEETPAAEEPMAGGTDNSLSSGTVYAEEANTDDSLADGTIFAKDDLTINGTGRLNVSSSYMHGIVAKDDLTITGGEICVNAPIDGIRVNDSFDYREATLEIRAGDDGIVQEFTDAMFYVESGSMDISCAGDAISAASDIELQGGYITISSGDDAIHSDASIAINGGTININKCYEGLEAVSIQITGGDITIHPEDDAINANGKTMEDEEGKRYNPSSIAISDGTLTIVNSTGNDADGLDSNGDIIISGGLIRIGFDGDGYNNAIDYGIEDDGVCKINGGSVIATGSYTMMAPMNVVEGQCSIIYDYGKSIPVGTEVTVMEGENKLLSWGAPNDFTTVNMTCPEMVMGKKYVVAVGDERDEVIIESEIQYAGITWEQYQYY